MANPRQVQRFIPRRDTFPGEKPIKAKAPASPVKTINPKQKQKKLAPVQQIQALLIILLMYVIICSLRNEMKKNPRKFAPGFKTNFNSTETIMNMLSDVCPYLGLQEQEKIQTFIGMLEAVNILNGIRTGSYQNPGFINTMSSTMDIQDRKLGIIKALKPYLPSENREIIDKTIHTYNAINKVSKNLTHSAITAAGHVESQNATDKITKLIEIVDPLVSSEQQQKLNQIKSMIKMYNTVESMTQSLSSVKEPSSDKVNISSSNDNNSNNNDNDTTKNITNALKSVLNPEQAQAMEVMMKMAQLLTQKSDDKDKEDD